MRSEYDDEQLIDKHKQRSVIEYVTELNITFYIY